MKVWHLDDAQDHVTAQAVAETSVKQVAPTSVLVVVRGMILAHTVPAALLAVPATVNQDMKAMSVDERISPEYLLRVLWALNSDLLNRVATSTHGTKRLPTDALLSFPVPLPPLGAQVEIVARVDALLALCDRLAARLVAARADAERLAQTVLADALTA